jgi:hypothetical protein
MGEATEELTKAYSNVLTEFLVTGLPILRLLPISGGIFSGPFSELLPSLSTRALLAAHERLTATQQTHLACNTRIELCVFMEADFPLFQAALEEAVVTGSSDDAGSGASAQPPHARI